MPCPSRISQHTVYTVETQNTANNGAMAQDADGSFRIDSQAPTVVVTAPDVTDANASTDLPYTFTLTYQDDVEVNTTPFESFPPMVPTVEVLPPSGSPISAQEVDSYGSQVTYKFYPPGYNWGTAPAGTYQIVVDDTAVTDEVGNTAPTGVVGSFNNNVGQLVFTTAAQTLTAGQPSGVMTVQIQDRAGNPVAAPAGGLTLSLFSYPPGSMFLDTNGEPLSGSTITVPEGSSTVKFKFEAPTAGTAYLSVGAGIFASQQETVVSPSHRRDQRDGKWRHRSHLDGIRIALRPRHDGDHYNRWSPGFLQGQRVSIAGVNVGGNASSTNGYNGVWLITGVRAAPPSPTRPRRQNWRPPITAQARPLQTRFRPSPSRRTSSPLAARGQRRRPPPPVPTASWPAKTWSLPV